MLWIVCSFVLLGCCCCCCWWSIVVPFLLLIFIAAAFVFCCCRLLPLLLFYLRVFVGEKDALFALDDYFDVSWTPYVILASHCTQVAFLFCYKHETNKMKWESDHLHLGTLTARQLKVDFHERRVITKQGSEIVLNINISYCSHYKMTIIVLNTNSLY